MTASEFSTKIREIKGTTTNDYSAASLIRDLNSEASMLQVAILRDRGTLEFDDSNYSDLPVATFSITSGTREYKVTADANSNVLLTKHKVAILYDGRYIDIPRVQMGEGNQAGLLNSDTATQSIPSGYYEIGESIVFVDMPADTTTGKVWFDREIDFLTTSDTSKVVGIPTAYHNLLAYRAAINYDDIDDNRLAKAEKKIAKYTLELQQYEENRRGDEATTMTVTSVSAL